MSQVEGARPARRRFALFPAVRRTGLALFVVAGLLIDSSSAFGVVAGRAVPAVGAAGPQVHAVVGLGDSVMAGAACRCPNFMSLLGPTLSTMHTPVATRNLAHNGLTSTGLLDLLHDRNVAAAVRLSDVAVVIIGANDFDADDLGRAQISGLASLRTNLTSTLDRLHRLRAGRPTRIVLTGYWNVFLDGAVGRARGRAYVARSDALTRAANAVIRDVALRHGAQYADLYAAFKPDRNADDTPLLAADGDHPSAAGHRVIAATVRRALDG